MPQTPRKLFATLLSTPLGVLGVCWTAKGLFKILLPYEGKSADTQMANLLIENGAELLSSSPQDPKLIGMLKHVHKLASGGVLNASELLLDDDDVPLFSKRVYQSVLNIKRGEIKTYRDIAIELSTKGYQAIGNALGANRWPLLIPCHRVLSHHGIGGFSAPQGIAMKMTLLQMEGFAIDDEEHSLARKHLCKADKELAVFVRKQPCRLPHMPQTKPGELLSALARAIAGQQLSMRAADTIFLRLSQLVAPKTWSDSVSHVLASTSLQNYRSIGLSEAKAKALSALGQACADGSLDLSTLMFYSNDQVVDALTKIKGIGKWTAEMFLIFTLARKDVFPVTDLGIRHAMPAFLKSKKNIDFQKLMARAEVWAPFRSVASWYLWRTLDVNP